MLMCVLYKSVRLCFVIKYLASVLHGHCFVYSLFDRFFEFSRTLGVTEYVALWNSEGYNNFFEKVYYEFAMFKENGFSGPCNISLSKIASTFLEDLFSVIKQSTKFSSKFLQLLDLKCASSEQPTLVVFNPLSLSKKHTGQWWKPELT